MTLRLGDTAPDFFAETTHGELSFYDWAKQSWVVFFSHPADFTPVCTTELGTVARYREAFNQRNVKTIAISVDPERTISELYGMIHPNASDSLTVRSVFIIDPDKKVRLTLTYPASTGRNFDEIIRVIDSLQLTSSYKVATPANWKHGEDVIVANSVKTEEIKRLFPKGHIIIKPYLRTTPQPNI